MESLYSYTDILGVIGSVKAPITRIMLYKHIANHKLLDKFPPVAGGAAYNRKWFNKDNAVGLTHYILTEINGIQLTRDYVKSLFNKGDKS